jgi:hypothetical protein
MDIENHYKEFMRVIEKYNLSEEDKAEEIAHFLTKHDNISVDEFAKLFAMDEKDALIFLSYIEKGVNFKTKHIDKK